MSRSAADERHAFSLYLRTAFVSVGLMLGLGILIDLLHLLRVLLEQSGYLLQNRMSQRVLSLRLRGINPGQIESQRMLCLR